MGPVDELAEQVSRTTGLSADDARRVVADVLAYFTETTEEYVRRRHAELQTYGARNPEIFARIGEELRPPRGPLHPNSPSGSCAGSSTADRQHSEPRRGTTTCAESSGTSAAKQAAPLLLEGLARLEHRGYDSAGVAVLGGQRAARSPRRPAGCVTWQTALPKRFAGKVGIGHTRWATHGPAERRQRPPARRRQGRRRRRPQRHHRQRRARCGPRLADAGVELVSETDTEVLAHLVAPLRGRHPRGQGDRRAAPDRGHLRPRRAARGLPGPDRGRPQRQPADHRHRRPRDARRLRPGRAGPLHHARSSTSTTARWPRHAPTASRPSPDDLHRAHRGPRQTVDVDAGDVRARRARVTSCTRRCSSSRTRRPSGCCAAGSTSGSAPSHLGGLEHGRPRGRARSGGSRSSAAARRTTSARWAPRSIEELARIPADAEAGQRVPLPQPGHRAGHAVRRGQPVRRDHRHPARGAGDQAQGRSGDRPGQRRRLGDRPRVRRRHLPARRPGGRGRVDQGADQHVPRRSRCSPSSSAGSATCRSPTAAG